MRKVISILIVCLTYYQCSNSEDNIIESEKIKFAKLYAISSDSIQFIITELESDVNNIKLLNDILKDTKYQVPYIHNYFYTIEEDHARIHNISNVDQASIISQNKKVDENYRFKPGDIKYYDTLNAKIESSILIQNEKQSYNKEVNRISRPYKLNENEVIIFFFETLLYYREGQPGPVVGGTWAIRFKKENNKWKQEAYYSGVDLS